MHDLWRYEEGKEVKKSKSKIEEETGELLLSFFASPYNSITTIVASLRLSITLTFLLLLFSAFLSNSDYSDDNTMNTYIFFPAFLDHYERKVIYTKGGEYHERR